MMFERACGACEQAKQVLSVYVGRWEESRSDLEIEVVVEDQDRRGGRVDGWDALGKPAMFAAPSQLRAH
jgi:hypothetical protein